MPLSVVVLVGAVTYGIYHALMLLTLATMISGKGGTLTLGRTPLLVTALFVVAGVLAYFGV